MSQLTMDLRSDFEWAVDLVLGYVRNGWDMAKVNECAIGCCGPGRPGCNVHRNRVFVSKTVAFRPGPGVSVFPLPKVWAEAQKRVAR